MTIQDLLAQLPEVDDLVGHLGLQTRRSTLESAAFGLPAAFALGAVAGIAAALLSAPRPGAELRAGLQRGFQETLQSLRSRVAAEAGTKGSDPQASTTSGVA